MCPRDTGTAEVHAQPIRVPVIDSRQQTFSRYHIEVLLIGRPGRPSSPRQRGGWMRRYRRCLGHGHCRSPSFCVGLSALVHDRSASKPQSSGLGWPLPAFQASCQSLHATLKAPQDELRSDGSSEARYSQQARPRGPKARHRPAQGDSPGITHEHTIPESRRPDTGQPRATTLGSPMNTRSPRAEGPTQASPGRQPWDHP
jgi:hypothetical protein